MLCGWEGNRRSGVALASASQTQWSIIKGHVREMSTPPIVVINVYKRFFYFSIKTRF